MSNTTSREDLMDDIRDMKDEQAALEEEMRATNGDVDLMETILFLAKSIKNTQAKLDALASL
jgi:hypothetical protein